MNRPECLEEAERIVCSERYMIIAHTGRVRKIYKTHTDNWCIEIIRTNTTVKGTTKYIGFKRRPDVKVGDMVYRGQEI